MLLAYFVLLRTCPYGVIITTFTLSSGLVCPLWVLGLVLAVLALLCFFLFAVIHAPQELLEWSRCLHDCLACHMMLQLMVVFEHGVGAGFGVVLLYLW